MGKRDELIETYAKDIKEKAKMEPDMELLTKVTIGCGPTIYRADSALIAASDKEEMARVKKNFLIKKLGFTEEDDLDGILKKAVETYGKSVRRKHRAVMYYLITVLNGKEDIYA